MPVFVSIVVPCFNEEEVLSETTSRLVELLERMQRIGKASPESKVYFVDDGSSDRTWELICGFVKEEKPVVGIKLSRNRGHQNALLAGLFTADGDAVVSIDADLQDDVNAIEEMIDQYDQGYDIVYGVRQQRNVDTFFKRATAKGFYKVFALLGADTIYNHADYRLLSRRAIEHLKDFREVNLFLRGIVPLIGYKSRVVYYDRTERFAGESKYPLKKMVALALDAVTSFSVVPLRMISILGFLVFIFTGVMSAYVLWTRLVSDIAVPGWASTLLPIYFLGGIQLLSLGVIGEYLGKLYGEVKSRPRYLIDRIVGQ